MNIITKTKDSTQLLDWTMYPSIAIDAEWYKRWKAFLLRNGYTSFISKQFTAMTDELVAQYTLVLWDKDFPPPLHFPTLDHPLKVIVCDVNKTVLSDVVELAKNVDLEMFYSPKDVEATVGDEVWRELLISKDSPISKKRNLGGKFTVGVTTYTIRDNFGVYNCNLDDALKSVGIDNPWKGLVEEEKDSNGKPIYSKSRMDVFVRNNPDKALKYMVGDTIYLGEALNRRVAQINEIIKSALGDKMPMFTVKDFPRSAGSLVAKTFENWLMTYKPELYRAVMMLTDTNESKYWKQLNAVKAELTSLGDLFDANKTLRKSKFVHGLAMGSIRNFALLTQNTGLFGAVVQGGRCVNEDPKENSYHQTLTDVVDIDLSGCYGTALQDFPYPMGIPTLWENAVDDTPATLGGLLHNERDELVDGLYTIYVSGTLSFEQDLIHSKYGLTTSKIQKTILGDCFDQESETENTWDREVETAHLGGEFILTRKQIEKGVITSEVLEKLRAVATNKEFKEILNLSVDCCVYYPKSLELSNDEFIKHMMNPGKRGTKGGSRGAKREAYDKRSRRWTQFPLKEFIGKFISYRGEVKSKSVVKGDVYDLLQNSVKLFINTTYGDEAAPYFPMGNTVLANNITAKARSGVWMLSKALLTKQSITDGGIFTWQEVAYLSGDKKPGLETLANRDRFIAHRAVKVKPLTDKDVWTVLKNGTKMEDKSAKEWIDELCTNHINEFWGCYGLALPFKIEVKYDHTARKAAYFGSGDYYLKDTICGKDVLKSRGAKEEEHPKKLFLKHILEPDTNPLPPATFEHTALVGVKEFQKCPGELLPGDEQVLTTYHRPLQPPVFMTYKDVQLFEDRKRKAVNQQLKELVVNHFGAARLIKENKLKP